MRSALPARPPVGCRGTHSRPPCRCARTEGDAVEGGSPTIGDRGLGTPLIDYDRDHHGSALRAVVPTPVACALAAMRPGPAPEVLGSNHNTGATGPRGTPSERALGTAST